MKIERESNFIKIIYIQAQNAVAAPPLGTISGNVGVNTLKFCEEFNKFTKNLPLYFFLKVKVNINDNKTFNFNIISLSITYILKLLKFKFVIKNCINNRIYEKEIMVIKLKNIIILAIFKFPEKNIEESFNILFGIVKSINLKIIK